MLVLYNEVKTSSISEKVLFVIHDFVFVSHNVGVTIVVGVAI